VVDVCSSRQRIDVILAVKNDDAKAPSAEKSREYGTHRAKAHDADIGNHLRIYVPPC
jgi:hypothetical protein